MTPKSKRIKLEEPAGRAMPVEYCDSCNAELEDGQIGKCQECQEPTRESRYAEWLESVLDANRGEAKEDIPDRFLFAEFDDDGDLYWISTHETLEQAREAITAGERIPSGAEVIDLDSGKKYIVWYSATLKETPQEQVAAEAAVAQAERETRIEAGSDDGQRAQRLLDRVREAQTAFWDAVSDLEAETGLSLDSSADFQDYDLDSLPEEE